MMEIFWRRCTSGRNQFPSPAITQNRKYFSPSEKPEITAESIYSKAFQAFLVHRKTGKNRK
jgi:hypothetical protein